MTTYIINQLLQAASVDAGCNAFGIGHRAFDNLALGRVVPFCWINTIDCEIRILDNVSFENTYSITGNILLFLMHKLHSTLNIILLLHK